jgi:pimeloyl-ACP methyl ester carboxylesterase
MEHVVSADGTTIAYERSGSGPPLVLVHGSLNDRTAWALVVPAFGQRFTVFAMDRRGRGESGLPTEHALERQFEDVAAVIEAAGEPVDLLGHSYGAHCALGAAALVPGRIKHLVLYEPPTPGQARGDLAKAFEALDESEAIAHFLREGVRVPAEQVELLRATPFWSYLCGFAGTMPSEGRALIEHRFQPERFASLTMPALFLVGSQTQERLGEVMRRLSEHMPNSEWFTFEGHGHAATMTAPALFTETVISFLSR